LPGEDIKQEEYKIKGKKFGPELSPSLNAMVN